MSSNRVELSLPPTHFWEFPSPGPIPAPLPPPAGYGTLKTPFPISKGLYEAALSPMVPLTIAILYATTASFLNQINRSRGYKPYGFSRTRAFYYFVVLHNVGLALFSAVSFLGIFRAVSIAWPGLYDMEGLNLARVADSMCRLHGPRGFGEAVIHNMTTDSWQTKSRFVQLAPGSLPDPTDAGRIWNEGLAFWGWVFYLSKFYEVVDTAIILAKGKRGSTLQIYHHSGAMLCMWAGIRYMSPPIWIWVLFNSAIHTLMYVYYTISTLNMRVPVAIKKTMTTLQILQMSVGMSVAAMHLFVAYEVPVSVAYSVSSGLKAVPSAASAAVHSLTHQSAGSAMAASATGGAFAWLKQLAFRAAGNEGLAENVQNVQGKVTFPGAQYSPAIGRRTAETQYRNEYEMVRCVPTPGQAFAIWLNVLYLLPLTMLFARFFYKSYIVKARQSFSAHAHSAARQTAKQVEGVGEHVEQSVGQFGTQARAGTRNSVKSEAEWLGGKSAKANGRANGASRRA